MIKNDTTEDPESASSQRNYLLIYRAPHPFGNSEMMCKIINEGEFTTLADLKVLHLASEAQLPCYWEPNTLSIAPHPHSYRRLRKMWRALRNYLRKKISSAHIEDEGCLEENAAHTTDELFADAEKGSLAFAHICDQIKEQANGTVHFGPNRKNILKSKESILTKVKRMQAESGCTEDFAIAHIEDALRGIITFRTPQQFHKGLEHVSELAANNDWHISLSNLWNHEEDYGGYVDVDMKIAIPLEKGHVIGEIQFHLSDFYDGTDHSFLARAHKIYEAIRMIPVQGASHIPLSPTELNEISRLYFTTALSQSFRNCF